MQKAFQKLLLAWYSKHRRDLPWRRTRDPYAVWVSEMMLQQTQVSTVLPYYRRFLKAFPTLKTLARAPEERVLKLWEGLGYYARARNLRKACRLVVARHGGRIPQDPVALGRLPGIGPYTAGAILSIAFQRPFPVVDGNVARVLCRIYGIRKDPSSPETKRKLWELARSLVPQERPGDFNQALMELGATVCTPANPCCPSCPLALRCTARRLQLENVIPLRARRARVKKERAAVALIRKGDRVLLRKRPSRGLLGGLWEFPQLIINNQNGWKGLEDSYRKEGIPVRIVRPAFTLRHRFTHLDLKMECYECVPANGFKPVAVGRNLKWIRLNAPTRVPLSRAHQKIAEALIS